MITFIKRHWLTINIGPDKARLCIRQPTAIEGVRYQSQLKQLIAADGNNDEAIVQTHIDLLLAVIVDSEDWSHPFPIDSSEAERRRWIEALPFHAIGKIAESAFMVGLVPLSVE